MSIEAAIQRLTNDGEIVVGFLVDTMQGNTNRATAGHRLRSAEWLAALGGFIPESAIPQSATVRPRPKPKKNKRDKRDKNPKVTEKQILHFDLARFIKKETRDGETLIEFLIRIVTKGEKDSSDEYFTVAARMRAAKELLIRGFGNTAAIRRIILSGKTEALDSALAKDIRSRTNNGMDAARFLLDVVENENPEKTDKGADGFAGNRKDNDKPAVGFTAAQRVWAACELLRRAYDIRTDHITHDHIQAYWNSQSPADAREDAPSSPGINRLGFNSEDSAAQSPAIARSTNVADNARNSAKSDKRADAVKEKPDAATKKRAHAKQPAVAANTAAAEKRAHDQQPSAKPDSPPASETRATRRRETRAARKAEKRAAKKRSGIPFAILSTKDIADVEAEIEAKRPAASETQRREKRARISDNISPNARSP